jgi:hypothetical protein
MTRTALLPAVCCTVDGEAGVTLFASADIDTPLLLGNDCGNADVNVGFVVDCADGDAVAEATTEVACAVLGAEGDGGGGSGGAVCAGVGESGS